MFAAFPLRYASSRPPLAGIIGLFIAHALLKQKQHGTVAIIERKQLCSGATGAGQGYIWMAHRDPATPSWPLAARSKQLWAELTKDQAFKAAVEWQQTGASAACCVVRKHCSCSSSGVRPLKSMPCKITITRAKFTPAMC